MLIEPARPALAALTAATLALSGAAFAQDAVTRTVVAGPPRHPDTATLVEEVSIGVVDGPPEYTFGRVYDIAVARDDAIYVFDLSLHGIRRYDAAGKHLVTFGRAGQGPGDIGGASGMAVLADGNLALHDSRNGRVNIYSPTGADVAQRSLSRGGATINHRRGFAVDTAGFAYILRTETSLVRDPRRPTARPALVATEKWLRLRPGDGAVVDSVIAPSWNAPAPFRAESDRGWRQMAMPYSPRQLMRISPLGGVVVGTTDRYAFELRRPGGPIVTVRRDTPPPAVGATEYAEVRNRIETRMREVDPRWSWAGRDIPRVKPHYQDIDVGLDGRIWITRDLALPPPGRVPRDPGRPGAGASPTGAADDPTAARPGIYDVFEPDGTFIGTVQAPLMVTLFAMRGDRVWGVARDENDVESVKRYRVVWSR